MAVLINAAQQKLSHMDAKQPVLQRALAAVEGMVKRGVICRRLQQSGRNTQQIHCKVASLHNAKWASLQSTASMVAVHALRAAAAPQQQQPYTTVLPSTEHKRPASERFRFMYSSTPAPSSAKDLFVNSPGRPAHTPLFVWRVFEHSRSSSSNSSSSSSVARRSSRSAVKPQPGSFLLHGAGSSGELVELVPWVVVDRSAALPGELGLFAWRKLVKGQLLGLYIGDVLGPVDVVGAAFAAIDMQALPEYSTSLEISGHIVSGRHNPYSSHSLGGIKGMLPAPSRACCQGGIKGMLPTPSAGHSNSSRQLYDPAFASWPGMYAHMANDATALDPKFTNNMWVLDEDALVEATADVGHIYNPFASDHQQENWQAELLWGYGERFHNGRQQ
jgi:hypothetical protein